MKKLLLSHMLLYTITIYAQTCDNYFLLQNNKTIEMTFYNKKGDVTGKQIYSVSGFKKSGETVSASIASEMFDKKGKSISSSTNSIKCTGGVMMMDMKMMMPQQQQQQSAQVTAEGSYIDYPANMQVGETLKDATFAMDMTTNGMNQNLSMNINNRKVEAKENVTTAAGSWEAYKISFSGKMSIKTMGIGIPVNMSGSEWFAPGFGIVKTESNFGKTEITAIR